MCSFGGTYEPFAAMRDQGFRDVVVAVMTSTKLHGRVARLFSRIGHSVAA